MVLTSNEQRAYWPCARLMRRGTYFVTAPTKLHSFSPGSSIQMATWGSSTRLSCVTWSRALSLFMWDLLSYIHCKQDQKNRAHEQSANPTKSLRWPRCQPPEIDTNKLPFRSTSLSLSQLQNSLNHTKICNNLELAYVVDLVDCLCCTCCRLFML